MGRAHAPTTTSPPLQAMRRLQSSAQGCWQRHCGQAGPCSTVPGAQPQSPRALESPVHAMCRNRSAGVTHRWELHHVARRLRTGNCSARGCTCAGLWCLGCWERRKRRGQRHVEAGRGKTQRGHVTWGACIGGTTHLLLRVSVLMLQRSHAVPVSVMPARPSLRSSCTRPRRVLSTSRHCTTKSTVSTMLLMSMVVFEMVLRCSSVC